MNSLALQDSLESFGVFARVSRRSASTRSARTTSGAAPSASEKGRVTIFAAGTGNRSSPPIPPRACVPSKSARICSSRRPRSTGSTIPNHLANPSARRFDRLTYDQVPRRPPERHGIRRPSCSPPDHNLPLRVQPQRCGRTGARRPRRRGRHAGHDLRRRVAAGRPMLDDVEDAAGAVAKCVAALRNEKKLRTGRASASLLERHAAWRVDYYGSARCRLTQVANVAVELADADRRAVGEAGWCLSKRPSLKSDLGLDPGHGRQRDPAVPLQHWPRTRTDPRRARGRGRARRHTQCPPRHAGTEEAGM